MKNNFGGVVWTNHALERMNERGIKQGDAWATWKNPDQSRYAKSKGAWIYYRTFGNTKIEVVAKENTSGPKGKKEWVIISVWSGDVLKRRDKHKKRFFVKNILRTFIGKKK